MRPPETTYPLVEGYWKFRSVRDGPWRAMRVWFGPPVVDGEELDRSWRWQMTVDGALVDDPDRFARQWDGARGRTQVEKTEHDYILALRTWATEHAPEDPYASPSEPVDWRQVPLPL